MTEEQKQETWTDQTGAIHAYAPNTLADDLERQPAKLTQSESTVAKHRRESAQSFARETLLAVASSPALETGTAIHAEDKEAFLNDALAELDNATPAVRARYRDAASQVVDAITAGDRLGAEMLARELSFDVARETEKRFDPDTVPQPDARALAAAIHAAQYGGPS